MENILKLLERDARLTNSQLAAMLGTDEESVASEIKRLENDHVILGYKTLIDWEKTDKEVVTAIIEVRVTPQRGEGFEKVAERIYQFEEVESLYLMSGGFDLAVFIVGRTMREVALFVATKLAPVEGVASTATHFILKKYKESGVFFATEPEEQERGYLL